jgi:hypothetical protein
MAAEPSLRRAILHDVAAASFMAGYCSDRPGEELTAERIDRIHAQFDEWWGQIATENPVLPPNVEFSNTDTSSGLPSEGESPT